MAAEDATRAEVILSLPPTRPFWGIGFVGESFGARSESQYLALLAMGKISARELADSGRQIGEVFVVGDRKLILTLQYPFIRAQNPLDSVRWWPVLFSFYLKGPAPRGKVA